MSGSNVVLIGMPGSGKSTVGVLLAKALGFDFIDTDLMIQLREGCRLEEIIRRVGIERFLDIEGEVCAALEADRSVIATGGSAIYRPRAMEHLGSLGPLVYLQVDLPELERRLDSVSAIKGRGVTLREGQTLADLYAERIVLYERFADLTVSEDGQTMEDTVAAVLEKLREP